MVIYDMMARLSCDLNVAHDRSFIVELIKTVLKLVIDIYLEISNILKNSTEELDNQQFEQFENELYVVKEMTLIISYNNQYAIGIVNYYYDISNI